MDQLQDEHLTPREQKSSFNPQQKNNNNNYQHIHHQIFSQTKKIVYKSNHQKKILQTHTPPPEIQTIKIALKENKQTMTYCSLSGKMLLKFSSCHSR